VLWGENISNVIRKIKDIQNKLNAYLALLPVISCDVSGSAF